ncbi:MAG: penicillin-binding protein 2 [Atopococcus tabaci]|uniref:Penicillin-binding protein 2 n=1 Tax=Atopococcus tabaci TaxID=269774 RepID=A0AA43RJS1_9LACT|nr:penicillin-binding protein 2 [Atopococcus tabaci]
MKNSNRTKPNKEQMSRSHIPSRLNLMFFIVFVLFVTLIFRLAYLQIIQGDEFAAEVQRTEKTIVAGNVPRGEIYDANHQPLVMNEAKQTITYMRGKDVGVPEMANVAERLAQFIAMPHETELTQDRDFDLSIRDLKDYYVAVNADEINDRLTDEEKQLSGSEFYNVQLENVTTDDLEKMDEDDLAAAAIFQRMNSGYALSNQTIKNEEVTDKEIADVSEHLAELPGVSTGTDWERTYPHEDMLRSVLGSVSTEEQGIPEQASDIYLAQGYLRNDRVGQSYLEEEYEPVLKGTKSRYITETNQNGEITNQIEDYAGKKGSNLVLNVDMDFQERIENLAVDYLGNYQQGLNNQIYIVAQDPMNGDVKALVGKKINFETGEIEDDALGTFTQNFEAGSVIKGATILAASMDGVLDSSNNIIVDQPLYMAGTPPVRSVFNPDGSEALNDITALEVSSNIYMGKLAMRMGGVFDFENGDALVLDEVATIEKMRRYFEQFGLGAETGIDLPGEQVGYKGPIDHPGQAVYFSFGQFDSYTPLQLSQYITTIANGGVRYAPNVVSEIRATDEEGNVGALEAQNTARILNTVDADPAQMERVQQGMYQVIHGSRGTASNFFTDAEFAAAGKTGTAEAVYYGDSEENRGDEIINRLFVGYAPYDNPEIAITVVVPYLPLGNNNYEINNVSKRAFDAYFQTGEYAAAGEEALDEENQEED